MSAEAAPRWQSRKIATDRPSTAFRRPVLRALPASRPRMGRLSFAVLVVVLLAVGLAGVLILNTTIQAQSMRISQETRTLQTLQHQQAVLSSQVDTLRGPESLQNRAKALGMRPNPHGTYIDLRTGKVVGTATRVTGKEVPGITGDVAKPAEVAEP